MVFIFLLVMFCGESRLEAFNEAELNYCHSVQKLICFIFLEREIFLLTKIKEFLKSYSSLKFQIHTELSYLQVFEANKILKNIAHIALKLQNCFKHS